MSFPARFVLPGALVLVVGGLLIVAGLPGSPDDPAPDTPPSGDRGTAGPDSKSGRPRGGGPRPAAERVPHSPAEARAALQALGVELVGPRPGRHYYELAVDEMPVDEQGEPLFLSAEAFLGEVVLTALELDARVRKFSLDGSTLDPVDLRAIARLEDLEIFDLVNSEKIEDLGPLSQLDRMRELSLRQCKGVTDLSPLRDLKRITDVSLNDTGVTDLTALGRNNTLRTVHISHGTPIKDLSPLATCSNLKSLTLAFVEPDTASLARLPRLQSLSLINVPLEEATALQGLSRLRSLQLRGTGLTGLEPLSALGELRYLGVESPHISRLNPLHGLDNLESVSLVGTAVEPAEIELLQESLPDVRIEASGRSGSPPQ